MKPLNLRKGQRTKRSNRILVDLIKLKNRNTDRTVGIEPLCFHYFVRHGLTSSGNEQLKKKLYNLNNQDQRCSVFQLLVY